MISAQDAALYAVAIVALVVILTGCGPRAQASKELDERQTTRFQSCMELAAKSGRQSDDDVADIVTACMRWAHQ